jgi:hypothetical protein
MRDELVFGRAFADAIAETPCPQINHEQKLGKHQPERAAHLTYNIPAGLAQESQTADLT